MDQAITRKYKPFVMKPGPYCSCSKFSSCSKAKFCWCVLNGKQCEEACNCSSNCCKMKKANKPSTSAACRNKPKNDQIFDHQGNQDENFENDQDDVASQRSYLTQQSIRTVTFKKIPDESDLCFDSKRSKVDYNNDFNQNIQNEAIERLTQLSTSVARVEDGNF